MSSIHSGAAIQGTRPTIFTTSSTTAAATTASTVTSRPLTLQAVPPAVVSNGVVLFLSPSEGLSLLRLSRGFQQALRREPRLILLAHLLALETANNSFPGATGNFVNDRTRAMRNRLTAQWRNLLNTRMAAGIEVPHQSAVMTLGSINQTLSSRGIVQVDASVLREWPMNEVLDAVAQSAWNADDVSETFHLVVPPKDAYYGSYIDAWQDTALSNEV